MAEEPERFGLRSKERLSDKLRRDIYVRKQLEKGIPYQLRALRHQAGWTQRELADRAGTTQSVISRIENQRGDEISLATLLRFASAFDVGLIVRFAPFSELVDWVEGRPRLIRGLSVPASMKPPPFIADRQLTASTFTGEESRQPARSTTEIQYVSFNPPLETDAIKTVELYRTSTSKAQRTMFFETIPISDRDIRLELDDLAQTQYTKLAEEVA